MGISVIKGGFELFKNTLKENEFVFTYLEYSSVIFKIGDYLISIDPAVFPPDIFNKISKLHFVLYTHSHSDHFNLDTALKIYETWASIIFAPEDVHKELYPYLPSSHLIKLKPRIKARVKNLTIATIEGKHVCPILLYLISLGNLSVFHGGDSGHVDLSKLSAKIAFVPVGYPSPTASPEDAVRMVEDLKPKYTIPIHGRQPDFKEFIEIIKKKKIDTTVIEAKPGEVYLLS